MRSTSALPLSLLVTALHLGAQVLSIQDLTTEKIGVLDCNKTAVTLPAASWKNTVHICPRLPTDI